ncbi:MAG: thermonuclease family protein [Pseudomonadota bacterium]
MNRTLLSLFACLTFPAVAVSDAPLPGPIPADVIRVVDGDTIKVRAQIWVDQSVEVSVRLAGIDAPEIYRPRCDAEKAPARAAKAAVAAQIGDRIYLHDIRSGKYAGRVVAETLLPGGESLSARLLAQGHALPVGADKPWCTPKPERQDTRQPEPELQPEPEPEPVTPPRQRRWTLASLLPFLRD